MVGVLTLSGKRCVRSENRASPLAEVHRRNGSVNRRGHNKIEINRAVHGFHLYTTSQSSTVEMSEMILALSKQKLSVW